MVPFAQLRRDGGASALLRAPSPLFQISFAASVLNAAEPQRPRRALCGPVSRSFISAGLLIARRGAALWLDVRRARPQLSSRPEMDCAYADYLERNYNRI